MYFVVLPSSPLYILQFKRQLPRRGEGTMWKPRGCWGALANEEQMANCYSAAIRTAKECGTETREQMRGIDNKSSQTVTKKALHKETELQHVLFPGI